MYPTSPPTPTRSTPFSPPTDESSQHASSSWSSASSPTESEANFLDEYEEAEAKRLDEADNDIHTPPMTLSPTSTSPPNSRDQGHEHAATVLAPSSKSTSHPYPRPSSTSSLGSNANSRPRIRGLAPLSSMSSSHGGSGQMPKSQPLSRALFNRMASDTPHAGMKAGSKPKGPTKLIVPTKAFRTTFELGLSASELARR